MKIVSLALLVPCFISSIYPVCKGENITTPEGNAFLRNSSSCQNQSKLYDLFECAMNGFKSTTDYVFRKFNLEKLQVPPKYLLTIMHRFILNSDSFMRGENRITVNLSNPDLEYAKWYKLVTCKENETCYPHVGEYSQPLREKLNGYFDSHRSELELYKTLYPITKSLDFFYQYFGVTMQRVHKLGCLYEQELRTELKKFAGGKEDFVDVFHQLMPEWSIGQLEIDLVNIAWYVGGGIKSMDEDQRLLVGYDLGNKYKNMTGRVIPISHNCIKTTTPAEK